MRKIALIGTLLILAAAVVGLQSQSYHLDSVDVVRGLRTPVKKITLRSIQRWSWLPGPKIQERIISDLEFEELRPRLEEVESHYIDGRCIFRAYRLAQPEPEVEDEEFDDWPGEF